MYSLMCRAKAHLLAGWSGIDSERAGLQMCYITFSLGCCNRPCFWGIDPLL